MKRFPTQFMHPEATGNPGYFRPFATLLTGLFVALGIPSVVSAHQPGSSSLVLSYEAEGYITGEFHIADVDLESVNYMLEDQLKLTNPNLPFKKRENGGEALAFMQLSQKGTPLGVAVSTPMKVTTDGNLHTMIPFKSAPLAGHELEVRFDSFFQFDPQHRVVISLAKNGDTKVGILTLDDPSWSASLKDPSAWHQFLRFTWEGVWHIWIGIDHILFLIALLLPSVLRYKNGKWHPVSNFKDAFYNVLKVVTAFTIAHSVTLTLAALDIVTLPSKLVESVIAISVVLAALNNIYPMVSDRVWTVALGFGFIHGFGFANVLADLQLPTGTLAVALLSFNVGVELGQLAIVAVFFPLIFLIRRHPIYLPIQLRLGSAVIALIASAWVVDRVFELEFMPF